MNDDDRLLASRQPADWPGVSVATLERWRTQDIGPRYAQHGRWLHTEPPSPEPEDERLFGVLGRRRRLPPSLASCLPAPCR